MCKQWIPGLFFRSGRGLGTRLGVVTPIGAVLTTKTGDATRSPGHRALPVMGSLRFFEASRDPWRAGL